MKISKSKLLQILKEEFQNFLSEHEETEIEEGVGYVIIINGEASNAHYGEEAEKLIPLQQTLKDSGIEDVKIEKVGDVVGEIERAYHPGDSDEE